MDAAQQSFAFTETAPAAFHAASGYAPVDYVAASHRELEREAGAEPPKFNAEWRKLCSVRECSVTAVESFVQAHYLRKRPAIVLLCLVMLHGSRPVGTVIYSAPPREADKRYGGKTWELARLYLLDEITCNAETWLIAQSVKWIKRHRREVQCLVSYADPSAGHSGTIYKASNWLRDGRTDDERKSPRCDYYDARTGKKYGRRGNMPADAVIERRPRVSKHRFWMPLGAGVGGSDVNGRTPKGHNKADEQHRADATTE